MAERDDSFLARWSRRKRADGAEPEAKGAAPVQAESGESTELDAAQAEIVDRLPDIDSLDEHADFTVFLQKGVPEELRRRALRRLWRLNPVFANLDGLAEYDEDFTVATTMLDGLKTVYQVGKGMPGPAEPAEPRAADQETAGAETSATPGGNSASAGDNEAPDAADEGDAQQIAQAGMTPISTRSSETAPPQEVEVAPDEQRAEGIPRRAGRSATERRWGRLEG